MTLLAENVDGDSSFSRKAGGMRAVYKQSFRAVTQGMART